MSDQFDEAPKSYTWNTDGTIATETVVLDGVTWVRTYTYASNNLLTETGWVRQ